MNYKKDRPLYWPDGSLVDIDPIGDQPTRQFKAVGTVTLRHWAKIDHTLLQRILLGLQRL